MKIGAKIANLAKITLLDHFSDLYQDDVCASELDYVLAHQIIKNDFVGMRASEDLSSPR